MSAHPVCSLHMPQGHRLWTWHMLYQCHGASADPYYGLELRKHHSQRKPEHRAGNQIGSIAHKQSLKADPGNLGEIFPAVSWGIDEYIPVNALAGFLFARCSDLILV